MISVQSIEFDPEDGSCILTFLDGNDVRSGGWSRRQQLRVPAGDPVTRDSLARAIGSAEALAAEALAQWATQEPVAETVRRSVELSEAIDRLDLEGNDDPYARRNWDAIERSGLQGAGALRPDGESGDLPGGSGGQPEQGPPSTA